MGVLDTIQTAAATVLAAPIALLGASFLLDGQLAGLGFLAIAVLLVVVQRALVTPEDIPGEVATRVVGRVVRDPEAEDRPSGAGTGGEDGDRDGRD